MAEGLARWANPSSPHAEGRAARAALEDARGRIEAALWLDGRADLHQRRRANRSRIALGAVARSSAG